MNMLESRTLGPITLDGGVGGGAMESAIDFDGERIPVRLEIDHPGALETRNGLGQTVIDDVDVVLEHVEIIDRIARDAIEEHLRRPESAPSRLFEAWVRAHGGGDLPREEFLRSLRPTRMTVTPDGGRANRDRVVVRYGVNDATVSGEITVRLPSGSTGPEVDPAPRNGY